MDLKLSYAKKEDIPEGAFSLYEEVDGKFNFKGKIEGLVSASEADEAKKKLKEFRDKNIELLKEAAKFKGVDPVKYKEAMDKLGKLEEGKLLEAGEIEEVVTRRVSAMKADFETQIETLKGENGTLSTRLSAIVVDKALADAAVAVGVRKEAIDDVVLHGKQVFSLQDGVAVIKDGDGLKYGKDGKTPLTPAEWVKSIADSSKPHWYPPSEGGGGGGGDRSKGAGTIRTKKDLKTDKEIAAYIREHGRQKYQELPRE